MVRIITDSAADFEHSESEKFGISTIPLAVYIDGKEYKDDFLHSKGDKFTKLAEGVMTSKALYKLGQEYGVDLPIVESVYKVLFDGTDIKEALGTLFMRSVKKEF